MSRFLPSGRGTHGRWNCPIPLCKQGDPAHTAVCWLILILESSRLGRHRDKRGNTMLGGNSLLFPIPVWKPTPRHSQALPQNRGSASQGPRLARAMLHSQGWVRGSGNQREGLTNTFRSLVVSYSLVSGKSESWIEGKTGTNTG